MYTNPLPLTNLTVINDPTDVEIQIEQRKVKFDDSITPTRDNAWVYVYAQVGGAVPPDGHVRLC